MSEFSFSHSKGWGGGGGGGLLLHQYWQNNHKKSGNTVGHFLRFQASFRLCSISALITTEPVHRHRPRQGEFQTPSTGWRQPSFQGAGKRCSEHESVAVFFLISWRFTSTETVWLIGDGGSRERNESPGYASILKDQRVWRGGTPAFCIQKCSFAPCSHSSRALTRDSCVCRLLLITPASVLSTVRPPPPPATRVHCLSPAREAVYKRVCRQHLGLSGRWMKARRPCDRVTYFRWIRPGWYECRPAMRRNVYVPNMSARHLRTLSPTCEDIKPHIWGY